ncbi:MAG: YidC/Oxa1 family membrane protein insertase [Chloroflexota bacterium]
MGGIWSAFVDLLENFLLVLYNFSGNAGIAIILFTIVARLLILPLTIKSLQSTRRMQELQPLLKELQRKHGKDARKLQEETMKLYRDNKVNPVGGCLPMLLQLPIFIGVYQAILHLTEASVPSAVVPSMLDVIQNTGASINVSPLVAEVAGSRLTGGFLWLENLGEPDPYYILPILSVIFQLLVQLMAMPRVQDPQQKAMMQSMLFLPLVFGYIGFIFPSGAVIYWVAGSILSVIQQYVISGWGSLANYLKFLPTDAGLFPPKIQTAVATAGASGSVDADATAEDAPKRTFWDVLGPLSEQNTSIEEEPDTDSESEQAKSSNRAVGPGNSRRRRSRRR